MAHRRWLGAVSGAFFCRQRSGKRRRPSNGAPVEALEERVLLAAQLPWETLDTRSGVLVVRSGEGADSLEVKDLPGGLISVALREGAAAPRAVTLQKTAVKRIDFYGDFGNDVFTNRTTIEAILYGGPGADQATGARVDESPAAQAWAYSTRRYLELVTKYRDGYGFVLTQDGTSFTDHGDAVITTGLAAVTAALRGDSANTYSLLLTLRDKPFVTELGRVRLIRHPDVWDYKKTAAGTYVRDRHAPLSKDGIVGVMTAAYYAYTAPGLTTAVRDLAKAVITKYVDYLIANGWKTLDVYPDHYWAKSSADSKKFANVFSNASGGSVMWKGPESYVVSPSDRYALQAVASRMGLATAQWQVWGGFAASLTQSLGSGYSAFVNRVADSVAGAVSARVDTWLQGLKVHENRDFRVISSLEWTTVPVRLDIELSQAARNAVTTLVKDGVRTVVVNAFARLQASAAADAPATLFQLGDLIGRVVDKTIDALPKSIAASRWRASLTASLNEAMPWLNGDVIGQLVAFRLSHELSKTDEVVAHLSFWPTLLLFETKPLMADLLGWSVKDLDGYLNKVVNLDADFLKAGLYRMDAMPYAWLVGAQTKVAWWLKQFENDLRFDSLTYAWVKPHSENVGLVLGGKESGSNRLDYLVLRALSLHGVPKPASATPATWVQHWVTTAKNIASDLAAQVKAAWDQLRKDPVAFAKALQTHFHASYAQIAKALQSANYDFLRIAKVLAQDLRAGIYETAKALYTSAGLNLTFYSTAKALNSSSGASLDIYQVAKALYSSSGLGLGYFNTAKALYTSSGLNLTFYSTAKALYSSSGANLDFYQTAKALYSSSGLNLGYFNTAKALYSSSGLGLSGYSVAKALYSSSGANLDFYQVAKALYSSSGLNLGYFSTAKALYSSSGLNLGYFSVAKALYSSSGANLDFYQVAKALYSSSGLDLSFYSTAKALYSSSGLNLGYFSVAKALYSSSGLNLGYFDVAKALYSSSGADLSYFSTAKALYSSSGLNLSFYSVAKALYSSSGLDLSASQVANALYSSSGLDLSVYQTAKALYSSSGVNLDSWGVANALYYGVERSYYTVARALYKGEGLDFSLESTAGALFNGIGGITWLSALAVVRSIA